MSEEELPTAAKVILTDDSTKLRKVEVADNTPDLLEVGDELVRRKDIAQRVLDRMRELDETNEDNWPILKELDALLCDLGCEDMAHEFRKKGDTEKKTDEVDSNGS